jgi:ADP-ribosyl-[dinitrogen reductase] hydrolase
MIRTSDTDPIRIAEVDLGPGRGKLGVTFAPGKNDGRFGGRWARDLDTDVDAVATWGAKTVVTLLEPDELRWLAISRLGAEVERRGMEWVHMPIPDVSTPGPEFEAKWPKVSSRLRARLDAGENMLVHCRGGIGRAGMIAARLLVEDGVDPEVAMKRVRAVRPGAIETPAQERWVRAGRVTILRSPQSRVTQGMTPSAKGRFMIDSNSAKFGLGAYDARPDRALGAFIGLAIGDALGTTIEFKARDTYRPIAEMVGGGPFGLRPGEWTDDTSMALCLADSLIANRGELNANDLAERFVRWWKQGENSVTGRCFDIGNTTSSALQSFLRTGRPEGSANPRYAGNGGIMRLAPAAIAAKGDAAKAAKLARAQSHVTHAAPECLDAADVLARVVIAGINGRGQDALTAGAGAGAETPKVKAIAEGSWRAKPRNDISSSGYVVDTLEAALWAVAQSGTFEEAVLTAVNLGDDADTVGAVTGQIAGAVWGYSAIPERWTKSLAWRERLIEIAVRLSGAE